MKLTKQIKRALVSVYHKEGLDEIIRKLDREGVCFVSTGGTRTFIESLGIECEAVEDLTGYPSILGGRVKTLHSKIFGGILARRDHEEDLSQTAEYGIPEIDLVIVDLYPFEDTVASGADESAVIEKIDIGGVSLIRAAAKNYKDVMIVASQAQYRPFTELLDEKGAESSIEERRWFAKEAYAVTSAYDTAIFNYFDQEDHTAFRVAVNEAKMMRYGENPHQQGFFYGKFEELFDHLHGKELSYNNLLDVDSAITLIDEFDELTFAVIKHNNACGAASRPTVLEAWNAALAGDPVSAYGGILVTNEVIDKEAAQEIDKIFFEIIIAPDYMTDALDILKQKKNRIILLRKKTGMPVLQFRSLLNGVLIQDKDVSIQTVYDLKQMTQRKPSDRETEDLLFANKMVKHSKSNAITLVKNKQLCGSGIG
ncbi:MAG: bifunctional phosphoribosylaminoimidazolecarboxamide formyltransferase/IMP cyclohydrolase, partial [Methanimicrococcus sp.]|nr:bifunctional phosphoribosylaminoimidazolecarboxamide formyltransferase/IMP cyclohydrolase [Methanimicrococcus sp.]